MTKDSVALSNYYSTLSKAEQTLLTQKIVERCKVNRYSVYNWKYGACRIPELYKDKIEEIIGKKIFTRLTK